MTVSPIIGLGVASLALGLGILLRRHLRLLDRLNLPPAVIGGFLFSLAGLALHARGVTLEYDNTLRDLLMVAFFTTVGLGARLKLLRTGGPALAWLLVLSSLWAVFQNLLGIGLAKLMGANALLGIVAGSLTLTGGPATALAFAPEFERAGVAGAPALALAAAMIGIIAGGLLGAPLATLLIARRKLAPGATSGARAQDALAPAGETPALPFNELLVLTVAMSLGALLGSWLTAHRIVLPGYIGAMIVAGVLRNLNDRFGWLRLSDRTITTLGTLALAWFIALALVGLKLWEIAALALPLAVILAAQVAFIVATTYWVIFRLVGRDYEAAVISGGFVGYMLGITPNAVANMDALAEKYGAAPRAYLVVPVVAAFLIDFTNALIITRMMGWFAN
ncbi:MAG TPA: sodium/glutamate symporter [Terriglobales bacterium]|nr:sodium/glutamate symporter [Terriglobales bacterium]